VWLVGTLVFRCQPARATAPTVQSFANPGHAGTKVPLKDFSFLLGFSENVQRGTGRVSVNYVVDPPPLANPECTSLDLNGRTALIPVTQQLESNRVHNVRIPSECFKDTEGNSMDSDHTTYAFTTVTKGTSGDIYTYDTTAPTLIAAPTGWGGVLGLPQPAHNTWADPQNLKFTLFFSEAVQKGVAHLTITRTDSMTTAVQETIYPATAPATKIEYSKTMPGKVSITPSNLPTGAEYTLSWAAGAFSDAAGNFLMPSTDPLNFNTDAYKIKVSTVIDSRFPDPAVASVVNMTKKTKLVFELSESVKAGSSATSDGVM
jgi:methionine-rich copper-binding protein CopC